MRLGIFHIKRDTTLHDCAFVFVGQRPVGFREVGQVKATLTLSSVEQHRT